jgi:hypothetical protein
MKKISLKTLICIIAIMPLSCKKEEKETVIAPQNTFSYSGQTNEFWITAEETKFMLHDCMSYNSMGGIVFAKATGIQLIFFDKNVQLVIRLIGESVGKYSKVTAFCNESQFKNTSLVQNKDGKVIDFIGGDSELEITKISNKTISGNFKIRVKYDPDFLNDSFVVGKFVNINLK